MKINIWGPRNGIFCFVFVVATSRLLCCDPSLPGKRFVLAKIVARNNVDFLGLFFLFGKRQFHVEGNESHKGVERYYCAIKSKAGVLRVMFPLSSKCRKFA